MEKADRAKLESTSMESESPKGEMHEGIALKVIIFGAGNVGTETAKLLLNNSKNSVILVDLVRPKAWDALSSLPGNLSFYQVNLLDTAAVNDLLSKVIRDHGRNIDAIISTVATFSETTIVENDARFFSDFDVCFFGNVIPLKIFAPLLAQKGAGKIVILSSTSAHHAPKLLNAYAPAKWALRNFAASLRVELRPLGVQVDLVAPSTMKNLYSPVFKFDAGISPTRVATKIAKSLSEKNSREYFIPARYRAVHWLERLAPTVLDRLFKAKRQTHSISDPNTFESVLITGASTGLGKELARLYAPFCKKITLLARSKDQLQRNKFELEREFACAVETIALDLSDTAQLKTFIAASDGFDLVVNNAGIHLQAKILDTPIETFQQILRTNWIAPAYLSVGFLEKPIKLKTLVQVLSTTAIAGRNLLSAYSASKAALWCFTKSLRRATNQQIHILEGIPATFKSELQAKALTVAPAATSSNDPPGLTLQGNRVLDSKTVAERIFAAQKQRRNRVLIPFEARLFLLLECLCPPLFRRLFQ
jgi:short-subunit dehydrogenase